MIDEKDIERKFRNWCKTRGHIALKLRPVPEGRGFPDRTIIMKTGKVVFIEFKKPGGKVSPHQRSWNKRLKEMRQYSFVCSSFEVAKDYIEKIEEFSK